MNEWINLGNNISARQFPGPLTIIHHDCGEKSDYTAYFAGMMFDQRRGTKSDAEEYAKGWILKEAGQ